MSITWIPDTREWHLHNGLTSWVLGVLPNGWIGLHHAGAPLAVGPSYAHLGPREFAGFDNRVGEPVGFALPVPGLGDFRVPGLVVEAGDGSQVVEPRYAGHRILAGKPELPGPLPATYLEEDVEADTLEVDLVDEPTGLAVTLAFTIFRDWPVVARSMHLKNSGASRVVVRAAMSATLDLPDDDWRLMTFSGAWARERFPVDRALVPGRQGVGSLSGGSGNEHNPSLVLRRPTTTEAGGECWGIALAWSGNFLAEAEVGHFGTTRVRVGVHPEQFAWPLAPGESFTTPEALLAWSGEGLSALSQGLGGLLRHRMARGAWRDRPRPILLNNWEGTYFDFDHGRLVAMARAARSVGVELFVLDDGWFGRRDSDDRSLGDWVVDRRKLPHGLDGLAREVKSLGLMFGLWIEPEMVNRDSDLFRAHPDWAIGIPGRQRTESRQQLVLDFSNPAVVDHIAVAIGRVVSSAPIDYVKWDWNRFITEPFSPALPPERQGEFFYRYTLGLYDLYGRLTTRFPNILFESCASGGARFDAGLLAWAPQAWTSDDTDAVERLRIQWGTSFAYPVSSMGAHVSAVPNHQTGRAAPLDFRAAVAMFGAFGYELDPTAMAEDELAAVQRQVAFYAEHRELLQYGRFTRLRSPFEGDGNEAAWMVSSPDQSRALVAHYRVLQRPWPHRDRLAVRGLDPSARYAVTCWTSFDGPMPTIERGGDELMAVGLGIEPPDPMPEGAHADGHRIVRGDFTFRLFDLRRL
jgi:alpha-galactosidase